ncbi:MAG: hypothetical protein QOD71_268 [Thermoleophilaceae bacterium]|jgi:hypothetical protein|nr:hypothetical protein [Thermoleophilaceae bacterium]
MRPTAARVQRVRCFRTRQGAPPRTHVGEITGRLPDEPAGGQGSSENSSGKAVHGHGRWGVPEDASLYVPFLPGPPDRGGRDPLSLQLAGSRERPKADRAARA